MNTKEYRLTQWECRRLTEFDSAAQCLGKPLAAALKPLGTGIRSQAREIRLRVGQPIQLDLGSRLCRLSPGSYPFCPGLPERLSPGQLQEALGALCEYSVYTHQEELKRGYLSLNCGHRAGIAGTAVYGAQGEIKSVRDITSVSIRISREFPGASKNILPVLRRSRGGLLLAGEPACGKTTILRDLCCQLSQELLVCGGSVCVIDERGEIACANSGVPYHDLGPCCDILNAYHKPDGMECAVRTLSPRYLVCDEIGNEDEARAVEQLANAGVRLIASAHAASLGDLLARRGMRSLLDTGVFETIVFLKGRDHIGEIQAVCAWEDVERRMRDGASDRSGNTGAVLPGRRFLFCPAQDSESPSAGGVPSDGEHGDH